MVDIAIIGGGIVGMYLSIALSCQSVIRSEKKRIVLYEKERFDKTKKKSDRQFLLTYSAIENLRHYGVKINPIPIKNLIVSKDRFWRRARFGEDDSMYYPLGYSIAEKELVGALINRIETLNIDVAQKQEVTLIEHDLDTFSITANNTIKKSQMLIVADGATHLTKMIGACYRQSEVFTITSCLVKADIPKTTLYFHLLDGGSLALVPTSQSTAQGSTYQSIHKSVLVSTIPAQDHIPLLKKCLRTNIFEVANTQSFSLTTKEMVTTPTVPAIAIGNSYASIPPLAGVSLNLALGDSNWLANAIQNIPLNEISTQYYKSRGKARSKLLTMVKLLHKRAHCMQYAALRLAIGSSYFRRSLAGLYDIS